MPLELKMVGSVGWLRFAISSLVKRHAAKKHELFIQQEIAEPHWLLHFQPKIIASKRFPETIENWESVFSIPPGVFDHCLTEKVVFPRKRHAFQPLHQTGVFRLVRPALGTSARPWMSSTTKVTWKRRNSWMKRERQGSSGTLRLWQRYPSLLRLDCSTGWDWWTISRHGHKNTF